MNTLRSRILHDWREVKEDPAGALLILLTHAGFGLLAAIIAGA